MYRLKSLRVKIHVADLHAEFATEPACSPAYMLAHRLLKSRSVHDAKPHCLHSMKIWNAYICNMDFDPWMGLDLLERLRPDGVEPESVCAVLVCVFRAGTEGVG